MIRLQNWPSVTCLICVYWLPDRAPVSKANSDVLVAYEIGPEEPHLVTSLLFLPLMPPFPRFSTL